MLLFAVIESLKNKEPELKLSSRLTSIDLLRGIVIILMALDHTRDFFAPTAFDPLDWNAGSAAWFWTRWITHLCAPIFVLLAGMSAFLRAQRYDLQQMSRYLLSRGLMLVVLEWTWVSFCWQFGFHFVLLQVIWAIGVAMMALSIFIWLPRWVLIGIAIALIVPHNLLDAWHAKDAGLWLRLWHQGGAISLGDDFRIIFAYPLMPWIGLMAAGYAMGPVMTWQPPRRDRFLLGVAILLMLSFIILRSGNYYGDPDPWMPQGQGWLIDLMAFIKVHKYPPSLLYLCITVSVGLFALYLLERHVRQAWPVLLLFGRHPLLFYMLHLGLIHGFAWLYMQGMYGSQISFFSGTVNPAYKPALLVAYIAWIFVMIVMAGILSAWQHRQQRNKETRLQSSIAH